MPLEPERGETMRPATLMTAERDNANTWYHEVLATLRRNVKASEDKIYKRPDALEKIRELFNQGRMISVPTHSPVLAKLRTKVTALTNDLEVKQLEF